MKGDLMQPRKLLRTHAIAWLTLLLCITPIFAQTGSTGALTGTVMDPTGAVVPRATVSLTNTATNQSRTATTGSGTTCETSRYSPTKG